MSASFKDLRVWQEAMKFAVEVYRVTSEFPRHELYGLSQQLRRAAVSVPSNIAEGKGHQIRPRVWTFLASCSRIVVGSTNASYDRTRITILGKRRCKAAVSIGRRHRP